jgi:hypothetical protein
MKTIQLIIIAIFLSFSAQIEAQNYSDEEIKTKQTVEKFFEYVGAKDTEKISSVISEKVQGIAPQEKKLQNYSEPYSLILLKDLINLKRSLSYYGEMK